MSRIRTTMIFGLIGLTVNIATSAVAQEQLRHYDSVKGWSVNSYSDNRGFLGCDAQIAARGHYLRVGYDGNIWAVGTQSNLRGVFPGNLEIDGRNAQVNFEHFPDGWAMVQMTNQEVASFRRGSNIGINLDQQWIDFSLSGSSAAMKKVEECYRNQGNSPRQRIVQNQQRQNNNFQQAPQRPIQQNRQQNQNLQTSQNQAQNVQPSNNQCRQGEQLLPASGLCTDQARRLLNISRGSDMQPLDGCSLAVEEASLPGDQILLYKALRCKGVTTKLEYGGGARFAELSVIVSGYDADTGGNPRLTEPRKLVTIGAVHNGDANTSLLSAAKSAMEARDKANPCKVVSGQPFRFPDDSLLVHTRSAPKQSQNNDGPGFDGGECGPMGYFDDSNAYWRAFGGFVWHFDLGQDIAEIDPGTFTVIERDKADQWQIVY